MCWGNVILFTLNNWTCVYALGQIDSLGIDELLKRIATDDKQELIHYSGIVLKMSLGCDDAIALVRARAMNEKDAAVVKRLLTFADWIDKRVRATSYR